MYEERLDFVEGLAREAGLRSLERFGRATQIAKETYGGYDITTDADLDMEQFIKERIFSAYGELILGEEKGLEGEGPPQEEHLWIIDPIDGTFNYQNGIPIYGICIGYCEGFEPVVGAISFPALGELFIAAKGLGAFCIGQDGEHRRIHASPETKADRMVLALEGPDLPRLIPAYFDAGFPRRSLRSLMCAALPLAYIAGGRMHAYVHTHINVWDCAAGEILIREAGGPPSVDASSEPVFPKYVEKVLQHGIDEGRFVNISTSSAAVRNNVIYPTLARAGFDVSTGR